MTQYSYSRVDLWHRCPYHYKLKYIDHLHEMPKLDADNPLIVGSALHKGIESGEAAMEQLYFDSFPVITEEQENEMMKLRTLLPKVQAYLDQFKGCRIEHEVQINGPDFIGYADLIITAPDGTSMVMDFKYSNSVDKYLQSGQLHLYKYYLDHAGYDVQHLQYLFIPKTSIRQLKQTKTHRAEDLYEFRKRIEKTLSTMDVKPVSVQYDEMQVIYFKNAIQEIETAMTAWSTFPINNQLALDIDLPRLFPKNPNGECFACNPRFAPEYIDALQEGEKLMPIPKNERRQKKADLMPDTWLYADSYVGKTVFWDSFPDVLMLNTDGNTDNTTSPVDFIKDKVTKEGRLEKRRFAWEQFLDDVKELELGNTNGFKTVVLDLVEDLYEDCRQFVLDKNGWEHEADGSYGKGWSAVTSEFHNAIKRLKAIGLQIVYISREERKDLTLKGGIVRTTFQPNINAKVANFLTGTVDITMRAYVNDNDKHMLQLQKAPNTFGGGRFVFKEAEVPLERQAFLDALADAQPVTGDRDANAKSVTAKFPEPNIEPDVSDDDPGNAETEPEGKPKRRQRKARAPKEAEPAPEPEATDEAPKRQRRTRKAREVTDDDDQVTPPGESAEPSAKTPVAEEPAPTRRRRRRRTEE